MGNSSLVFTYLGSKMLEIKIIQINQTNKCTYKISKGFPLFSKFVSFLFVFLTVYDNAIGNEI